MNPERKDFLELRVIPGRLTLQEAAWLLGFQDHDIPILVRAKLLRPLGKPAPNGQKFFARKDLIELVNDSGWLDRASQTLIRYHRERNRNSPSAEREQSSGPLPVSHTRPMQAA